MNVNVDNTWNKTTLEFAQLLLEQHKKKVLLRVSEKFEDDNPCVARFSDDFLYIAIGFEHGKILMKQNSDNSDKKKTVGNLKSIGEFDAKDRTFVTDIKFVHINKDNKESKKLCATYASGHVRIWRFTREVSRRLFCDILEEFEGTPREISRCDTNVPLCCCFSYDNERLVVGGQDTVIRVYDPQNLNILCKCKCSASGSNDGHSMQVCAVVYH